MSEKKVKPKKSSPTKPNHRNGKGDAPRNISEKFKKNYDKINWSKKQLKTLLSRLLYWMGHLVSVFLYCDYFAFLYPVYKKLMIWSSDLDKDGKVWDTMNK